MWFSKIDEFTCQGLKVTPENIKILITEKGCFNFFLFFTKNFLLDLLNFEKVCFWDGRGFKRYVQISSFSGDFGTTGVTKKVISRTRKIFVQFNLYQYIALEVGFHLIGHMYLILVGGVIRRSHDF